MNMLNAALILDIIRNGQTGITKFKNKQKK